MPVIEKISLRGTTYDISDATARADKVDNTVIAPVESGTTASQAYAIGEHFIRNNKLCTAKTAIASGDTLTKDTNYTEGNIDDALVGLKSSLGTAASKNSTSSVTASSTDLVESGAVKSAIDSALSSVYRPSGDKTVSQLVSTLLVYTNLGNVYNISDSGTTTSDFVGGSGKPIHAGDNVAIVDVGTSGSPSYKFDLLAGIVDLSNYISKSNTSGLVKNDGSIDTNTYLTSHQDISGKADKVASATNGHLAGLDANGNLTDSGVVGANVLTTSNLPLSTANGGTGNTNGYIQTGKKANTTIGTAATAEGVDNTASGDYSHAEGDGTIASGKCSHASGLKTVAGHSNQTVVGAYNNNKSSTIFEVGNGDAGNRRNNAFEVYSDGKISMDNGSSKFKFTQNGGVDGYYDASGTWHAFGTGGGKQTTIIDLSESNVVLDESFTDTVTVTYSGAAATFTSSDTSIATVDVTSASAVGNTYTYVITITAKKEGACSIEVDVPENSSYYGAKAYINVTVATAIYGAEWDGSSSPAWARTDMATNFVDPVPYYSGMSGTPSSPFDDIMPWKGMRRVTDAEAGSLVEIPKFYYKWTRSGAKMKLQISMKPFTGSHVSPAHADRGDGQGERNTVYVGRYHCASDYKSTTGVKPTGNITRATARSGIHNLASDIWQYDYAMYWTIMMLYLVEFADWNSQAKIGYGCGNNRATENMGSTDSMQYHTGTSAANRTTYGHTQYRYIEDLWSNVYDWVDGIYFSSSNIYAIKNPANFSDSSGGTSIGTRATTSNGYIKGWTNPSVSGFEYALYPNSVDSSLDGSTYICDYCHYDSSGVVLCAGGSYYPGQYCGAFCLVGYYPASDYGGSIGSRLMKLPANRL